jgi:hypothetical protein
MMDRWIDVLLVGGCFQTAQILTPFSTMNVPVGVVKRERGVKQGLWSVSKKRLIFVRQYFKIHWIGTFSLFFYRLDVISFHKDLAQRLSSRAGASSTKNVDVAENNFLRFRTNKVRTDYVLTDTSTF